MRVYLAGPSAELDRVVATAEEIRELGHELTEAWWLRVLEASRRGWKSDAEVPRDFLEESARRNLFGLQACDRVVAITRSSGGVSTGTAYEIGLAWGLHRGRPVRIVGDPLGFIGMQLGDVRAVSSLEEALAP